MSYIKILKRKMGYIEMKEVQSYLPAPHGCYIVGSFVQICIIFARILCYIAGDTVQSFWPAQHALLCQFSVLIAFTWNIGELWTLQDSSLRLQGHGPAQNFQFATKNSSRTCEA